MKKIPSLLTYFVIGFALALTPGCSLLPPLPDTVEQEVENALARGFDGIIVYVEQGGEPALYAAGWKNREDKIPADPHALFKIASISKLYIAAAAAKMVHEERLSLDKTLAEYLPELAGRIAHAEKITLRMMLKHRSGIPNFTDMPDYPWDNPPRDNREILELVLDRSAEFEPNKKYRYSNTNYLLIGAIMDSTLGHSHHQYIKEEILKPLGLNHTYSLLSEVDLDDVMSGYHVGYEPDIKYNDFIQPGGSMVATAEDVGIFLRALNDGSLFSEDEQAIYSSIYRYEHTGLLPGYQSIAQYHKELDAVVIQFVNTSGGSMWMKSEAVYRRVVRILKRQ
ncbi:serine hydrolase [Marinoscillum sp. 108]|uniref:serine hydrolase domain-containing protein n=1 Tax=Marinoscillum sp. 108 TaxID=2653151 RepID=UPI0012F35E00|nr:serine hydrolase domain-containing protein [Marinoscillum sp. 108]VXD10527.1 Beta-lactamase [Marinoscillum sp. 108]